MRALLQSLVPDGAPFGLCDCVPTITTPTPRETRFTASEIEQLLLLGSRGERLMILLCYDAGLRSGTASRVAWSHIHGNAIVIRTKRQSVVTVPMSPRLSALVHALPRVDGPLLSIAHGRTITLSFWRQRFTKLRREAGISERKTFHDLRRTIARDVYSLTQDLRIVQQLLGHQQLSSTLHYLHGAHNPEAVAAALATVTTTEKP